MKQTNDATDDSTHAGRRRTWLVFLGTTATVGCGHARGLFGEYRPRGRVHDGHHDWHGDDHRGHEDD